MGVASAFTLKAGLWQPAAPGVPASGGGNPVNPPPPPPPGGSGMLVGASVGTGVTTDFVPATLAAAGPWTVARRYQTGTFPNSFATDSSGINVDVGKRASAYSCKPDLALLVSSSAEQTRLQNFVASWPDSHIGFITAWHEPDVKIRKNEAPFTSMTLAQFNAAMLLFYEIVQSVNKPHLYTYQCLTSFSANGATSGFPSDFWVGPTGASRVIDLVTWDIYLTSNTVTTGSHEQANPLAWCQKQGAGYGITEIGIHDGVTDYSAAATWMHNQADYAFAHAAGGHSCCAFLCWFDSDNASALPVPTQDPAMVTASSAISTEYLTPYTTFVL